MQGTAKTKGKTTFFNPHPSHLFMVASDLKQLIMGYYLD
jgi:hypothetical protein